MTLIEIKPHRLGWKIFVFAVFGGADGQRAIRAVSACNTRASIRLSVFGGAHAFSC
jgi:hypothetical protein